MGLGFNTTAIDIKETASSRAPAWRARWDKMNEMKTFAEVLSPAGWMFFYVPLIFGLPLLTSPTWKEFAAFLFIDFLSYVGVVAADRVFFLRRYPAYDLVFPEPKHEFIAKLSTDERVSLFRELAEFPWRRANWVVLLSFPKDVIPISYLIWGWHHELPFVAHVAIVTAYVLISYAYFFAAVFIESHLLVSRLLQGLHKTQNWTDAFRKISKGRDRITLDKVHQLSLAGLAIVAVIMTATLIFGSNLSDRLNFFLSLIGVLVVAGVPMYRLWSLSFRVILEGIADFFKDYSLNRGIDVGVGLNRHPVALNPYPLLMNFGKMFNEVSDALYQKNTELSSWFIRRTEQSRFEAIGEISGLVAHDLGTPLHVVQFCTSEIIRDPTLAQDQSFVARLETGVTRCAALLESLRTYLRPSDQPTNGAIFGECFEKVYRLLEARYRLRGFSRIKWKLSDELKTSRIRLPEGDLMHVLLNLLNNSVHNLLSHSNVTPQIDIGLSDPANPSQGFWIRDYGTGMSREQFENYTSSHVMLSELEERKGLGLRLVVKLLARRGATLTVDAPEVQSGISAGTKMLVKFNDSERVEGERE